MRHGRNQDDYLAHGTQIQVAAGDIKSIVETFTGTTGAQGATGTTGTQGSTGLTGATGTTGAGGSGLTFTPVTLLDNQSTPQLLFSYPKTNRFSFFLISIERNGNFKQIYQQILTDGTTVTGGLNTNNVPSPDATGITLSKAILNDNVEVYYTSTNTGYTGTCKYSALAQWL